MRFMFWYWPNDDSTIRRMAAELLDLYARRTMAAGFAFPPDGKWQRVHPKKDERPRSGQQTLMRRARRRVSLARAR